MATCNQTAENQLWSWAFNGIAPDNEQSSSMSVTINQQQYCLTAPKRGTSIGAHMKVSWCTGDLFQSFWYDYMAGEIGNEATATCIGIC